MLLTKLTLYRGTIDRRIGKPIYVNMERVQCIEHHESGSRIQFTLGEPSVYVTENPEQIIEAVTSLTRERLRTI